ncbi:transcriptional repressor [Salinisphaera sp. USBA-960]|uniref:Fur family transcriptional regulator n=1 Tax=Salinisphaera orenii TaxID=856731 RepID=UPI000DBE8E09|nr:transcriptional repressor [Salifodinibacter halophilus]NNC26051.1 transcriptional repressor [Salifodinibacter halophilus]
MTAHTSATTLLRQSGLRITAHRRAVLEWLVDHPHATADQVHAGVHERLGSISKQAVYDVLTNCVDAQLVRQIKPAGHPARFERRAGDNHHHMICRDCGRIDDVDCVANGQPCLEPSQNHGFELDEAEVVFWGRCPDCHGNPPHS